MSTSQHLALARKWRPQSFHDVVGQSHTLKALENALNNDHIHHAYLFTGTRGVGKTTIARNFAKSLNCEEGVSSTPCGVCSNCLEIASNTFVDLIEVDAASKTKVEDTRDLLDKVHYAPSKGRFKIYLIDEVHMLSGHSFNALLKTLEEPPSHVKFLLATTDPQKLPATILSRCLQFHLTPLPTQTISDHLSRILTSESHTFEHTALDLIAEGAQGSIRDSLSLLEQAIAYGDGHISTDSVQAMLGLIDPKAITHIVEALIDQDANALLTASQSLAESGANFEQALADLTERFHRISIEQAVPGHSNNDSIARWAQQLSPEKTQLYYQITLLGRRDCSLAPTTRIGFEMTLLRLLSFYPLAQQPIKPIDHSENVMSTPDTVNKPAPTSQALATDDWSSWLPHLGLTGMSNSIARHCTLEAQDDHSIHLSLNPTQAPLLQPNIVSRIEEAVKNYLKKDIKVNITAGQSQQLSPQQQDDKQQQAAQVQREQTILNDTNVKTIMETFDATVIKESIIEKT
ncbi:MAG: DNA polymerase III subunit gamma/tau [Coxiellaceae bacterium]|nr:DNA polymerase III subunit gamma/tau [Coxiellaceae bacterium]|tara:strand:- start:5945 stop:7495 length:1551 start_codon:yes stop_codon:yes gene_type:complete